VSEREWLAQRFQEDRRHLRAVATAAREGDFQALIAVLHPDVVLRADVGAAPAGMSPEVRGDVSGRCR
jgi:hypothetical protein